MKILKLVVVMALLGGSLAACVGKQPLLIGKGKGVPPAPPPVVTKG